ncbi:MAG: D-glycerate dehydrogenase [Planctomycetaceae bacterium]|nr:D-glycerate dehydrogenase [Planctomycetaceae bacterium]
MHSKIVISYPLPGNAMQFLSENERENVWVNPKAAILQRSALLEQVQGAAGLVVTPGDGPINAEIFKAAGSNLKVVSCYSVGFDYVDIVEARRRAIAVGITPDATTEPTADIAWLLILGANRDLNRAYEKMRCRTWSGIAPSDQFGNRLVGKTLFVVGCGRIGSAVARRAVGWNMNLKYLARTDKPEIEKPPLFAQRVTLEQGLRQADFVSLHLPLNQATHHIIGANELAMMKESAVLINTARGGVIDEKALIAALRDKSIRAAGLDVYENEPNIDPELFELSNCLMLPHIGTATVEDRRWMTEIAMQNLLAGIEGKPLPNSIPA